MESGITKRLIQEGVLVREGGKHSVASVKTVIAENNQEFVSRLKDIHDALQKKTAFIEDIFQLNKDLSFDKIKRTPEKVEPTPVPVEETIEVEEDIQSEIDEETDGEERKLRLRLGRIISRLRRRKKKPRPKPRKRVPPVDPDKGDPRRGKMIEAEAEQKRKAAEARKKVAAEESRKKKLKEAEARRKALQRMRDASARTKFPAPKAPKAPAPKVSTDMIDGLARQKKPSSFGPSLTLQRSGEFVSPVRRGSPGKPFTPEAPSRLPTVDKTGRVTRYSDDARARRTAVNRSVRLTTTGSRSRGKVTGLATRLKMAPKAFTDGTNMPSVPAQTPEPLKAPSPVSRVAPTSPKPGALPATPFDRTPVVNTDSGRNRFVAEKLIKEAEDLTKKFEGRRIPPDVLIKIQAKIDTANNLLRTAPGLTTPEAEASKLPSVVDDADARKAELEKQKRLDVIQKANEQLEKQRAADKADPRAGQYDMQESKVRGKMLGNSLKSVLGGSLKVGGKLLVVLSVLGPLAGRNKVVDDTLKSIPIPGTDFTLFDIANDPRAQETNMPFLVELGKDVVTSPTDFIDLFTTLSAWAINKGFGTELRGTSLTENLINGPYFELLERNKEFIGAYGRTPEAKKIVDDIMASLESMSAAEIHNLDDLTVRRIKALGSPAQRLKFEKLRKEAQQTLVDYGMGYFIDDTLDARAERTRGEIEVPEEPGFFERLFFGPPTVVKQPGSKSRRDARKKITNITTDPTGSLP